MAASIEGRNAGNWFRFSSAFLRSLPRTTRSLQGNTHDAEGKSQPLRLTPSSSTKSIFQEDQAAISFQLTTTFSTKISVFLVALLLSLQHFINKSMEVTRNSVPVGYPVKESDDLLLNETGEENTVYGEIAIRSPHVALGYWKKLEITQARFLPDPSGSNKRIYYTGDMGRLRPGGSIEFVGRRIFKSRFAAFE